MAEYCLDCWNKINESEDSEKDFILSEDLDLCEGCGEWKPVIIRARKRGIKAILNLLLRGYR